MALVYKHGAEENPLPDCPTRSTKEDLMSEGNHEDVAAPFGLGIIGAGPAGIQTALSAAERGHRVTLWEKNDRIGGLLRASTIFRPLQCEPAISARPTQRSMTRGQEIRMVQAVFPSLEIESRQIVSILSRPGCSMT